LVSWMFMAASLSRANARARTRACVQNEKMGVGGLFVRALSCPFAGMTRIRFKGTLSAFLARDLVRNFSGSRDR
jgi:hypothetical protein